ncbi:hypothetical protein [Amycolatopsis decaplanina]|uniref:Uncharacterized protein n=1 Tax=Amycolatopsis decaplanina DSM 44594 TaxID=1284240 RepID=M2ZJ05_9PSEU|nr:hypothetical protein [Amycolatopsis decaplanina]EME60903.1 hypothetical protein H074_12267 [Amycolatopsis decaplanina DSM 44594]
MPFGAKEEPVDTFRSNISRDFTGALLGPADFGDARLDHDAISTGRRSARLPALATSASADT